MLDEFDDIRVRDLRLFERVAALGTISAAAQALYTPKGTASRWLASLERKVGLSLVRRTTRHTVLTDQGLVFVAHVRQILAVFDGAQQALALNKHSGVLRVSVPIPFGRVLGGASIARYRERFPDVHLEIQMTNLRVNLIKDRIDVAIRGGPLEDSELIAIRLALVPMWMYASTCFRGIQSVAIPTLGSQSDKERLRRLRPTLPPLVATIDDRGALADALIAGAGQGLLPGFLGEPARRAGTLVRVEDDSLARMPVHALFSKQQRADMRVRVFIDMVKEQLLAAVYVGPGPA